jgi:glucose-1-phosphate cytidylyltransferase
VKVVLFCGGLGMRIREYSERVPKPMVPIGHRPIVWHVMKYYAHFGHRDFVLCLGYKGEAIKDYFLNYRETISNDFVLHGGQIEMLRTDISDWRITFVDTGLQSNIGERLLRVRPHVEDGPFLANYADGLTDAPLPAIIESLESSGQVASVLCVRPSATFHVITFAGDRIAAIEDITRTSTWMNGGYFVFQPEIFDYIRPGEDLVEQPFARLIEKGLLLGWRHDGFWAAMDTLKDRVMLEGMCESGQPPWALWARGPA